MITRGYLKNRILVQDQGGLEFPTGGILKYLEDSTKASQRAETERRTPRFIRLWRIESKGIFEMLLTTVSIGVGCIPDPIWQVNIVRSLRRYQKLLQIKKKKIFLGTIPRLPPYGT